MFDPLVVKIPWRRKWQPSPVFLPGKSHGLPWRATVHGVAKGQTWLSSRHGMTWIYTHTWSSCGPGPGLGTSTFHVIFITAVSFNITGKGNSERWICISLHSDETAKLEFEIRFSDSISISINFNRLLLKVYQVAGIVLWARGTKIGEAAAGLRVIVL